MKVKCIDSSNQTRYLTKHREYEVLHVGATVFHIVDDRQEKSKYKKSRFVIVENKTFYVTCINNIGTNQLKKDSVYRVDRETKRLYYILGRPYAKEKFEIYVPKQVICVNNDNLDETLEIGRTYTMTYENESYCDIEGIDFRVMRNSFRRMNEVTFIGNAVCFIGKEPWDTAPLFKNIKEEDNVEEDIKMKKTELTFKEIIAQGIKKGQNWIGDNEDIIGIEDELFDIKWKNGMKDRINTDFKYTLERNKVSFEEAFVQYENEEWIESCVTGRRCREAREFIGDKTFTIEEIRGKWTIG